MPAGTDILVEISELDVQIAACDEEKASLPEARATLAAQRKAGADAIALAETQVQEAEQEQRRHEAVLADQEALVTKLEGQQHAVKTNEAYTALLQEIENARAQASAAETQILESMESSEQARGIVAEAQQASAEIDERAAAETIVLDDREKSLDQSLANLHRERGSRAEQLDAKLLAHYDKVAKRRKPAIAVAKGETCMGCRVGLPPQNLIELHKGESLITCGNCQRILVLERD
ncbi:MAG: C4-type zinc ribbon domain-containing protein [Myxococcota bacterium]